jgi:hypothetical protein
VCGGATELQFQLDDIDTNPTRASVKKAGSGLQFDTDSSENEIAACFNYFFDDSIEVPQAIREPFTSGDSPSAEELFRRDSIVALYKTEVRAAGSVTQIPRSPAYPNPLEGHALRAWRKLFQREYKTARQRARRALKRKRSSAAASRSPLDS